MPVKNTQVSPGAGSIAFTGATPTVTATANKAVAPTAATITLAGATPAVVIGTVVLPGPAEGLQLLSDADNSALTTEDGASPLDNDNTLVFTGSVPSVVATTTTNTSIAPDPATITLTGATPVVTATANVVVLPTAASVSFTGATPSIVTTANVVALPGGAMVAFTGSTPDVVATGASTASGAQRVNWHSRNVRRAFGYELPKPDVAPVEERVAQRRLRPPSRVEIARRRRKRRNAEAEWLLGLTDTLIEAA